MAHPKESKTSRRKVVAREREATAWELRKAGLNGVEIAKRLGVTPAAVSAILKRVMAGLAEETRGTAREIVALELVRLDRMHAGLYAGAVAGNVRAVEACLKIQERRAKLEGLDAQTKIMLKADVGVSGDVRVGGLSDETAEAIKRQVMGIGPDE